MRGDVAQAFGLAGLGSGGGSYEGRIVEAVEDDDLAWHLVAACRPECRPPGWTQQEWTDLFFPERGHSLIAARTICVGCPARDDCLAYALDHGEKHGVWGLGGHVRRTPHEKEPHRRMTRRPDLEARLDDMAGVTWRYERALPVDRIDLPSSASLQYRIDQADPVVVDRYAADMARGDAFPAVVVRESRGKLSLIGGNHRRAAAAQAGIATLDAYVVVSAAPQARLLSFEDNRTHGLPLTATERAILAARLVEIDGMRPSEAAETVGCPKQMVNTALVASRAVKRAAALGLPSGFADLPLVTRERLQSIDDDGLFGEATRAVLATRIGGNTVADLVRKIKAAPTVDDALDRIDATLTARKGRSGMNKRHEIAELSDAVFALLDVDPTKAADGVQPGDEQVWRDRLKRAATHLMAVDKAIAQKAVKAA